MPLVAATYMSMHDMDAIGFFALSGPGWSPTINKFALQTPVVMGQFPAAALIYRQGLVNESPVVTEINLNKQSLLNLEGGPQPGPQLLDELRKKDIPQGQVMVESSSSQFEGRAAITGRVMVKLTDQPTNVKTIDLSKLIDDSARVIRSQDGQVTWDFGRGVVTVNSAKAAGATGFLGSAVVKAGPMEIQGAAEFMSVTLVPLDDLPLTESKSMLLQVMTEQQNSGWKVRQDADGLSTIVELGTSPMQLRDMRGTISFDREFAVAPLRVTRLDLNGYKAGEPQVMTRVELDSKTLYYLIER